MKWLMDTWPGSRLFPMCFIAGLSILMLASPAHAYIGPGAGLGAVAVTIAVVLGGIFLFVGLVWFPLKRLIRGMNGKRVRQATEHPE